MKLTWLKNIFTAIMVTSGIALMAGPVTASASPISPHAYAQEGLLLTNYGGYFSSPYGQGNLYSNWSSSNPTSFITNEMWEAFNSNEWIETGDVDGSINGNYWAGHYVAYQEYNSSTGQYAYHEYTVGSEYPTGAHNFEVQKTGTNTWVSYVDFTQSMSFSFSYASSPEINVGIESNDNQNYFLSGTYDDTLEYKDSSNNWHLWPSAVNGDSNSLGWSSTFTYSTSGPSNTEAFSG